MVKVMIHMHNTLMQFCAEAFNTACYTVNRIFLRPGIKMTSYELWTRRNLNLSILELLEVSVIYLGMGRTLLKKS